MNIRLYLSLLVIASLAACQNEQTSAPQTGTEAASQTTSNPPTPAIEKHNSVSPQVSTVAVTKAAEQNQARDLQARMTQSKTEAIKAAQQLTEIPVSKTPVSKTTITPIKTPEAKLSKTVAPVQAAESMKTVQPTITAKLHETIEVIKTASKTQNTAIGDAVKGKSLARKCMTCHNFTAKKKVGPGLKAIVGRQAGIMADMKYSKTLAAGGWTWDEKNLAVWLCDSKKSVKSLSSDASGKTKMPAQRICDAGKQADIIAFLKTL